MILVDDDALEKYVADAYTEVVSEVMTKGGYGLLVATSTAVGKDLLPRVAAKLGAGMASDVTDFNADGTMIRPMWAGNVIATISIDGSPKVVSVRGTAFDAAKKEGAGQVEKASATLDRK